MACGGVRWRAAACGGVRWGRAVACGGARWRPIFYAFSSLWYYGAQNLGHLNKTCQKTAIRRLHFANGQILLIVITYVVIAHKYH